MNFMTDCSTSILKIPKDLNAQLKIEAVQKNITKNELINKIIQKHFNSIDVTGEMVPQWSYSLRGTLPSPSAPSKNK
jgi:hypothetical protein